MLTIILIVERADHCSVLNWESEGMDPPHGFQIHPLIFKPLENSGRRMHYKQIGLWKCFLKGETMPAVLRLTSYQVDFI